MDKAKSFEYLIDRLDGADMFKPQSWLVQRLNKPRNPEALKWNSFGGGLHNGGLTDDAMKLLSQCFEFDYMGGAEYEWGIVPSVLHELAVNSQELVSFSIEVPLDNIKLPWDVERSVKRKRKPETKKQALIESLRTQEPITVYILCHQQLRDKTAEDILSIIKEETQIRDPLRFDSTIFKSKYGEPRTWGWLNLDLNYFFFRDKMMFENTTTLFQQLTHENS